MSDNKKPDETEPEVDEDNEMMIVPTWWLERIRSYKVNYDEDYTGLF